MSISLSRLHEHKKQSQVLERKDGCMAGFYGVLSLLGVADEGSGHGLFCPPFTGPLAHLSFLCRCP